MLVKFTIGARGYEAHVGLAASAKRYPHGSTAAGRWHVGLRLWLLPGVEIGGDWDAGDWQYDATLGFYGPYGHRRGLRLFRTSEGWLPF